MKKLLILLFIPIFALTGFAQNKQVITSSSITYQIKNLGFNTSGTFGGLKAEITFDKDHLDASSITAAVDTKTVNSGSDMRDNHLKSADFFDVDHYPAISIKSVSFKQKGGNKFTGMFDLTIKNITKQIEVPFTYTDNGATAAFSGSFKINRLDYGIGGKSLTLSNETILTVSIQTTK